MFYSLNNDLSTCHFLRPQMFGTTAEPCVISASCDAGPHKEVRFLVGFLPCFGPSAASSAADQAHTCNFTLAGLHDETVK